MIKFDPNQQVAFKIEGDDVIIGKEAEGLTFDQFFNRLCSEQLHKDIIKSEQNDQKSLAIKKLMGGEF
jgi:hypothetical protein